MQRMKKKHRPLLMVAAAVAVVGTIAAEEGA